MISDCAAIGERKSIFQIITGLSQTVSNCLLSFACPYYADDFNQKKMKSQLLIPKLVDFLLLIAMAGLFAGCRTQELSGVKEYQQITAEASSAVHRALKALDPINDRTNPYPSKLVANLDKQVHRLKVDSVRIRARSQAILARGDAYFAEWSKNISNMENLRVRDLAEQHRPQLENSYSKIKLASEKAGAAFKPFMAGLQKVNTELETSPDKLATDSGKNLIRETQANGQQVLRELGVINSELNAITTMLTPTKSSTYH